MAASTLLRPSRADVYLVSRYRFLFFSTQTDFEVMATVETIKVIPMKTEGCYYVTMVADIGFFALYKLGAEEDERVHMALADDVYEHMYTEDFKDQYNDVDGVIKLRARKEGETDEEFQAYLDEAVKNGGASMESRKLSYSSERPLGDANIGTNGGRIGGALGLAGFGGGDQLRDASGRYTGYRGNAFGSTAGYWGMGVGVGMLGMSWYNGSIDHGGFIHGLTGIGVSWGSAQIGGAIGFAFGGPVGAFFGAIAGGLLGGGIFTWLTGTPGKTGADGVYRSGGTGCSGSRECDANADGENTSGPPPSVGVGVNMANYAYQSAAFAQSVSSPGHRFSAKDQ